MGPRVFEQSDMHCYFPTLNYEPQEQLTHKRHCQVIDLDKELLE